MKTLHLHARLRLLFRALLIACLFGSAGTALQAVQQSVQVDPRLPPFGLTTVLPNGNSVVVYPDEQRESPYAAQIGAIYLYNAQKQLISKVTGSTDYERIGSGGVTVLANGNFVVFSPYWKNGTATSVGAITWINGTTGLSGILSTANSLTGYDVNSQVSVVPLPNGNYVVSGPNWSAGSTLNVGALTWCSGTAATTGTVSATTSLVGTAAADQVGSGGISTLASGYYLVRSPACSRNGQLSVGAVTFCSGTATTAGAVSLSNSLMGSAANDSVGSYAPLLLYSGHYVVLSPSWTKTGTGRVGAVTWGSGSAGVKGEISAANSLIGSTVGDTIGADLSLPRVTALSNGHYVVNSRLWDNGSLADAGACTWCDGSGPTVGPVSAANSLVGSTAGDLVGSSGVTQLTNGHYVVTSSTWDEGEIPNVGAVTWVNGTTGLTGPVTSANSLVGSTAEDNVSSVTALANGHYLVRCRTWDNGTLANAGVVAWCDGATGRVGTLTTENTLYGTHANDEVGNTALALPNGNYVVSSPLWDSDTIANVGAITWGSGATGLTGPVTSANSFVGTHAGDAVGSLLSVLNNGHYITGSTTWDSATAADVGLISWGSATTAKTGEATSANSLTGTKASDQIGLTGILLLPNGNYVVRSALWDNGTLANAGAATWCSGTSPTTGPVSAANSLVGARASDGIGLVATLLSDSNYTISSRNTRNSASAIVGSVTWGSGATGVKGEVSLTNSLFGSSAAQAIGSDVRSLGGGAYAIVWSYISADATTTYYLSSLGLPDGSVVGVVDAARSVQFQASSAIPCTVFHSYDAARSELLTYITSNQSLYPYDARLLSYAALSIYTGASTAPANLVTRNSFYPILFAGPVNVGQTSAEKLYTLRNDGPVPLVLSFSPLAGDGQPGDFQLSTLPPTLAPGATTTFTVKAAPTAPGERLVTTEVLSNVLDASPFQIRFSVFGLIPVDDWRQTHFGTTASTGEAADDFDADGDGLTNLMEYATGSLPKSSGSSIVPTGAPTYVYPTGNFATLSLNKPLGVTGVTYTVEVSSDLQTWYSGTAYTTITRNDNYVLQVRDKTPITPGTPRFIRLKVTR